MPYLGSVLLHTGWLVGLELVLELVLELEVELEANSELVGLMFALWPENKQFEYGLKYYIYARVDQDTFF